MNNDIATKDPQLSDPPQQAPPGSEDRAENRPLRRLFGRLHQDRKIQIITAICCIALLASPVAMVIAGAFQVSPFGPPEWTLDPVVEVMTNPSTFESLWNTVALTIVIVALSMIAAIFFATLATRTNVPLRWLIFVLMAVLIATPPLFTAISWGLLGNRNVGLINVWLGIAGTEAAINIESWWGLVFVSAIRAVGFQFFLLMGPFAAMDRNLEEAARISGASARRTFFGTQLPVLFPAIAGVGILSIIVFLESFELPQILGVPAGIYVLPTEIFSYLNDTGSAPKYGQASAISLILMVILVLLVMLQNRIMGRRTFTTLSGKGSNRKAWDLGKWKWPAAGVIVIFGLLGVVLPAFQLVLVSLSPFLGSTGAYSLNNFTTILNDNTLMASFGETALVAGVGALLATVGSAVILWVARMRRSVAARVIEFSQWLPAAVPGLVLALGVLWLILRIPGVDQLYGTPAVLIFAVVITVIPLIGRAVGGSIVQVPRDLEEAAWISGSSKLRALISVVGRLAAPSFLNGWLLCYVVISGTLAVPLLLASRSQSLISVNVYSYYITGRPEMAAAIFVLLILQICAVAAVVAFLQWLMARSSTSAGKAGRS